MLFKNGDFFENLKNFDAGCVLTNTTVMNNGSLCMGGGQARAAADMFPSLPKIWGERLMKDPTEILMLEKIYTKDNKITGQNDFIRLIAYPTKRDVRYDATINYVVEAALELNIIVRAFNWKILVPSPGTGLGGLDWQDVKPEIDFLDDRVTIISNVPMEW